MQDELVTVFRALTVDDAQRLADKLQEKGIEAFVASTEAPMYHATQGPSARLVQVREPMAATARELAEQFAADWHPEVPADEWPREHTGLEQPIPEGTTDDSPNDSPQQIDNVESAQGRLAETDPQEPEAPEVEGLQPLEDPSEPADPEDIERFGADRDVEQHPGAESPELERRKLRGPEPELG